MTDAHVSSPVANRKPSAARTATVTRYHVYVGSRLVHAYMPRPWAVAWVRSWNKFPDAEHARCVPVRLPLPS